VGAAVDTSGLERLAWEFDHGAGSTSHRAREFAKLFPSELAKVRRQVYRQVGLLPVPVGGSAAKGLRGGYFMSRLGDGTLGYLQRRTDDCLQASSTQRAMSVEIDGKRVPLTPQGIERAQGEGKEVGKKLTEAVRAAVDNAGGG
jgi:hypothetical protein